MTKKFIFLLLFCVSSACASGNVAPRTGRQLRVAIVDTGLDLNDPRFKPLLCSSGHRDFTGLGIKDTHGHGTHIAGIIKKYAGNTNYCLVIIKYYDIIAKSDTYYDAAMIYLRHLNPDIVNYSGGGKKKAEEEVKTIRILKNTTFIVSAGNKGSDLEENTWYPASLLLPNIIPVGSLKKDLTGRSSFSNYNRFDMKWEVGENVTSDAPCDEAGKYDCTAEMRGTSQATARYTARLLSTLD